MFQKIWSFIIEKKVLHDLGAIFIILAVLICAYFFCNCAAPEKPDPVKVVEEGKETVAEADKLQSSGQFEEKDLLDTIDKLKASVTKLIKLVEKQKAYIAYTEKKIKELKDSIEYTIGSYVVWIGIVFGVIVSLYVVLKIYGKFGTPTGLAATIISKL